jgi:hypothetical protein
MDAPVFEREACTCKDIDRLAELSKVSWVLNKALVEESKYRYRENILSHLARTL